MMFYRIYSQSNKRNLAPLTPVDTNNATISRIDQDIAGRPILLLTVKTLVRWQVAF